MGAIGFFWTPGGAWVLWLCMVVMLLGVLGAGPVLGAYTAELFDTTVRGQAVAWATVVQRHRSGGRASPSARCCCRRRASFHRGELLGIGPVLGVVLVWRYYPDTHNRELEDVHLLVGGGPERGLPRR